MYMMDDNTECLEAALKADLGRLELESQLYVITCVLYDQQEYLYFCLQLGGLSVSTK